MSYARLADGTLRSCGREVFGELGDGGNNDDGRNVPGAVASITGAVQISAGSNYALAVRNDGSVVFWGQLPGGAAQAAAPTAMAGVSSAVSSCAGASPIALLADGSVVTMSPGGGPLPVAGLANVTAISCGATHYLALLADGSVRSWGRNNKGQLGNGTLVDSAAPLIPNGLGSGVVALAAGYEHSLVLRADGTLFAFGDNARGQLGDGSTTSRPVPQGVPALASVVRIAAGGSNSMALRSDKLPFVWGDNTWGQLGGGSANATPVTTPAVVPGVTTAQQIAIGWNPSTAGGGSTVLAGLDDGSVLGWGLNSGGKACVGSSGPLISSPMTIPGLNIN